MFYCDACARRKGWPEGFMKSFGPCEVCGRNDNCSDVPSKYLPVPPGES